MESWSGIMRVLFVVVHMLLVLTEGRKVDIQREIRQIVRHHNNERRSNSIRAPYMMQMGWDPRLAAEAQRWADQCEYRRPNPYQTNLGSNLFYKLNFVQDRHAIHKMVNEAIQVWRRGKSDYQMETACRRSCDYAQMVYYKADQIGCAINTCRSIQAGSRREPYATLLVCLYSPRIDFRNSRPFRESPSCSSCPRSTTCKNKLCARPDSEPVPIYVPEPAPTATEREFSAADEMRGNENQLVMTAHNRQRENNNLDPLRWDYYLERWAKWVVSCDADYPGPRHCYTNFARLNQGEQLQTRIYDWSREGVQTNRQFLHGCRTPGDNERCNHNTNIQQPQLTSMACATKACDGATRQMVCIYDNRVDRAYRRSEVSAPFRTSRRRQPPSRSRRRFSTRIATRRNNQISRLLSK